MEKLQFKDTSLPQHGEFTLNLLSAEETAVINSVVNWTNPGRFAHLIFDVGGRSITFRSPDQPEATTLI